MNTAILLAILAICVLALVLLFHVHRRLHPRPDPLAEVVQSLRRRIAPYEAQFGVLDSVQLWKILQKADDAPAVSPPLVYPHDLTDDPDVSVDRFYALEEYHDLRLELEFLEEDLKLAKDFF